MKLFSRKNWFFNKQFSKTFQNEARKQKWVFLEMLLGKLDASLLGNLLTGKRVIRTSKGAIAACQIF